MAITATSSTTFSIKPNTTTSSTTIVRFLAIVFAIVKLVKLSSSARFVTLLSTIVSQRVLLISCGLSCLEHEGPILGLSEGGFHHGQHIGYTSIELFLVIKLGVVGYAATSLIEKY